MHGAGGSQHLPLVFTDVTPVPERKPIDQSPPFRLQRVLFQPVREPGPERQPAAGRAAVNRQLAVVRLVVDIGSRADIFSEQPPFIVEPARVDAAPRRSQAQPQLPDLARRRRKLAAIPGHHQALRDLPGRGQRPKFEAIGAGQLHWHAVDHAGDHRGPAVRRRGQAVVQPLVDRCICQREPQGENENGLALQKAAANEQAGQ